MSRLYTKPETCPVCGQPAGGKVLVCETCWWKVAPTDRATLRAQFDAAPDNPAAWRTKAEKIIRKLRGRGAAGIAT